MSIFGKRSGSDKKKKLNKKELKALQERRETERAAELERTYELYRFTMQMTGNIPGLPPLHMDVAHFFRNGFNHKLMTVGELAKLIKERDYVNLTGDQIESILSDAMVMTRYPISLVPRDKCMLTTYVPVSAIAQEKAAMMMLSRIAFQVKFDDYSTDKLIEITELMLSKRKMTMTDAAMEKLRSIYDRERVKADYGNGRFVRKIMDEAEMNLADRVSQCEASERTLEFITRIEECDIPDIRSEKKTEKVKMGLAC